MHDISNNNDLLVIIDRIVDKLSELFHYVNEYNIIFSENDETKKVLEGTHSRFLEDLYWLYWNFLTIRICNLMDVSEINHKKNLSFKQLDEQIKNKQLSCKDSISGIIKEIESIISPFKIARTKAFAHFDLAVMSSKEGLKVLSMDDIELIISKFALIINLVNSELKRDTLLFGLKSNDGSQRLLNILRMGIEYRNGLKKKKE